MLALMCGGLFACATLGFGSLVLLRDWIELEGMWMMLNCGRKHKEMIARYLVGTNSRSEQSQQQWQRKIVSEPSDRSGNCVCLQDEETSRALSTQKELYQKHICPELAKQHNSSTIKYCRPNNRHLVLPMLLHQASHKADCVLRLSTRLQNWILPAA